jgi:membrane protease YdiL (CAAX protease family)
MFRFYERPFWRSLGFIAPPLPTWWIVISGLATALSVSFLGNLIGTPTTENEITKLMKDPLSLTLMAVFGVLIAPLCEELAFRGFLQPLIARRFGPAAGILGAALPFGILHYREYGNSWRHALLISFAGAAFGLMRWATRSTLASTLMHAAYNSLFFIAFFAAKHLAR